MVNPHYQNLTVCPKASIIMDSGGFQKSDMINRCTPQAAFKRQRSFEYNKRPDGGLPWRYVTYDCLRGVDEEIVTDAEGGISRIKQRGSEETAEPAVRETIFSAEYYASRRDDVEGGFAYAAQGATVAQYMRCVRALLDLARSDDWLALGGFCIIGRNRKLVPQFLETCAAVAPLLKKKGTPQVHVLGVGFPDALVPSAQIFRSYGIQYSMDTSGMELQAINGREWHRDNIGDRSGRRRGGPYRHRWTKAQKHSGPTDTPPGFYNPCELALTNIERITEWAMDL